jgi:lipoprotein-releasing system ATP-binding protein
MSVAVQVRGVRKAYLDASRRVEVLRGIDLAVEPGELVAIVGPSGSGKSTLLHLLGGLDLPDAGTLEIGGQDLSRLSGSALARFRNRTLGYVFQFHQLLPDFTALENVMLPGRIAGQDADDVAAAARALLAEVGLEERLDHFPNQLSGGERQRVALCRALVLEPALLLADEPTGNLDPATGEQVFELLRSMAMRHGTTMILVTHNPELARRCTRIFTLDAGGLMALPGAAPPTEEPVRAAAPGETPGETPAENPGEKPGGTAAELPAELPAEPPAQPPAHPLAEPSLVPLADRDSQSTEPGQAGDVATDSRDPAR